MTVKLWAKIGSVFRTLGLLPIPPIVNNPRLCGYPNPYHEKYGPQEVWVSCGLVAWWRYPYQYHAAFDSTEKCQMLGRRKDHHNMDGFLWNFHVHVLHVFKQVLTTRVDSHCPGPSWVALSWLTVSRAAPFMPRSWLKLEPLGAGALSGDGDLTRTNTQIE